MLWLYSVEDVLSKEKLMVDSYNTLWTKINTLVAALISYKVDKIFYFFPSLSVS
jgi:hypothetical protein